MDVSRADLPKFRSSPLIVSPLASARLAYRRADTISKNQPVCLILNCCVTLRVFQRKGFSVTQIDRQHIEQQIEQATESSKLNVGPEHYWNCCAPELCVLAKRLRLAATGI